jgi:hypothetical protein
MNLGRSRREVKTDYSSFMPIVLMTVGWCATVLIVNTIIIVSNPENVRITSVIRGSVYDEETGSDRQGSAPFPHGNKAKEPVYVDVHRDHLVMYPGGEVVSLVDLEKRGNAFERLLAEVGKRTEEQYVVLLLRPRASLVARQLRTALRDRGIDVGYELYEQGRTIDYDRIAQVTRQAPVK